MIENSRRFQAGPDPFGRIWEVEFRWLQTGISIRHADTVDVKFALWTDGEEKNERVIALGHPDLLALSKKCDTALSDPWCLKLAALHLKNMIETGEDMEKRLVTVSFSELETWQAILKPEVSAVEYR
ncbi:MAG: hypothetical protein ABI823_11610 [Bryobacteraceae bacterium]